MKKQIITVTLLIISATKFANAEAKPKPCTNAQIKYTNSILNQLGGANNKSQAIENNGHVPEICKLTNEQFEANKRLIENGGANVAYSWYPKHSIWTVSAKEAEKLAKS